MKEKLYGMMRSVSVKIIIIIMILVLPLNVIAIAGTSVMIDTLIDQTRIYEQNVADSYMTDLESRMGNALSLLGYYRTQSADCMRMTLQENSGYEYQNSKLKFNYDLRHMAGMIDGGDGYFFKMKKLDDIVIYGDASYGQEIIRNVREYLSSMEHARRGWHIQEWDGKQYLLLLVDIKDVAYGSWIHLDSLAEKIKEGMSYRDFQVIFSEEQLRPEKGKLLICEERKGIWLNIGINEKEILRGISVYRRLWQIMAIVYLILIPALYLVLRRFLISPLRTINYAHRQIQEGNQKYRIEEKANSVEYEEAYVSFNQMAENLNHLKIEAYERRIEKQKMELRNLQLQIRPHFLLNTFNLIYTLVQRQEMKSVQDIVIYLSDYFRYLFRNGKDLELFSKEKALIEGYIGMAAIRYQGRVKVDFQLVPEIDFVRVPPLLIMNFVENAVKYGIKKEQVLHILIVGEYDDRTVTFVISDDGNGMDKQTLQRNRSILSGEWEPEEGNEHLGLLNSYKRIKNFYGDKASVHVESQQGAGTSFKICFPYSVEIDED